MQVPTINLIESKTENETKYNYLPLTLGTEQLYLLLEDRDVIAFKTENTHP